MDHIEGFLALIKRIATLVSPMMSFLFAQLHGMMALRVGVPELARIMLDIEVRNHFADLGLVDLILQILKVATMIMETALMYPQVDPELVEETMELLTLATDLMECTMQHIEQADDHLRIITEIIHSGITGLPPN